MIPEKELPQEQTQEVEQEAPAAPAQPQQGDASLRVSLAAMKVLYDKSTSDGVVRMLTKTGDPMNALVQTSMFVLRILFDQSKGKIPPDVLTQASGQVVSLLAELGQAAGVDMQAVEEKAKQVVAQQLQQKLSQQPATPGQSPAMPAGPHKMPNGQMMNQPTGMQPTMQRRGIINSAHGEQTMGYSQTD